MTLDHDCSDSGYLCVVTSIGKRLPSDHTYRLGNLVSLTFTAQGGPE
jgi:hypothetical protein